MQKQPAVKERSTPIFRNTPEKLRYFYHPDHIGSTSWVTDSAKNGIQYCEYLPYGEPFLEKRSTTWNSRYTFSGKERDGETGYSYFGARYYNSDISIWLSVDPLSDKYPHQSNYVYCSNNPIRIIDPNGEDEYEFTSTGQMKNVKTTDFDSFHKVDENGNRVEGGSLTLDKKVVTGQVTLKSDAGTAVNYLKVTGDDEAKQIFEHLASNSTESNTEYGLTRIGDKSGSVGKNMIGANVEHKEGSTAANRTLFDRGYTIREANHNHPNDINHSSHGDIRTAALIQSKFPKATFNNYTKTHGYTPYDRNTVPIDFGISLPAYIARP